METLRKNEMEMLKIKNTVTEMKTAFDRLISRWTKNKWARRNVNRNFQNWNTKEKQMKKNRTSKKYNIQVMAIAEGKERIKINIWSQND